MTGLHCPGTRGRSVPVDYWWADLAHHKERHVIMSFSELSIKVQVYQAIKPVLDKADALLDYYLADAPVEVWGPIARALQ